MTAEIIYLTENKKSWIFYHPKWLESTIDDIVAINKGKPTERHVIKMMGKDVLIPRYQQAYGVSYTYSGTTSKSIPFTPEINSIKQQLEEYLASIQDEYDTVFKGLDLEFNMCLTNWYDDGDHYIGPHSDDETQFSKNSVIAGLSWGASRIFRVKSKSRDSTAVLVPTLDLKLQDGDLFIMGGDTQKTHTHEIPKSKACIAPRISFTFRKFEN